VLNYSGSNGGLVTCSIVQEVKGALLHAQYSGSNGGLVTCSIVLEVRGALLHAQLFR
jgi:hypothetical protein